MTTLQIPVEPIRGRGGFRKPLSVRQFVVDHLAAVGEDYASHIHLLYKERLKELAELRPLPVRQGRGRKLTQHKPYKVGTLYSFTRVLQSMVAGGLIRKSGRVEASDSVHCEHWETKPQREYYILA